MVPRVHHAIPSALSRTREKRCHEAIFLTIRNRHVGGKFSSITPNTGGRLSLARKETSNLWILHRIFRQVGAYFWSLYRIWGDIYCSSVYLDDILLWPWNLRISKPSSQPNFMSSGKERNFTCVGSGYARGLSVGNGSFLEMEFSPSMDRHGPILEPSFDHNLRNSEFLI